MVMNANWCSCFHLQGEQMTKKDERLKLINEVLKGMKVWLLTYFCFWLFVSLSFAYVLTPLPFALWLKNQRCRSDFRAVASMKQDEAVASSWFWPFFFWRNFSWLRRLKTWSRTSMVNGRLNGLALAYIHKPTEIDSSSVLKRWDASGHRRIPVAFGTQ